MSEKVCLYKSLFLRRVFIILQYLNIFSNVNITFDIALKSNTVFPKPNMVFFFEKLIEISIFFNVVYMLQNIIELYNKISFSL